MELNGCRYRIFRHRSRIRTAIVDATNAGHSTVASVCVGVRAWIHGQVGMRRYGDEEVAQDHAHLEDHEDEDAVEARAQRPVRVHLR